MTLSEVVRHWLRPAAVILLLAVLVTNLAATALAAKPFPFQVTIRNTSPVVDVAPGDTAIADASCLPDEKVLGGGVSSGNAFVNVSGSSPLPGRPKGGTCSC